MTIIVISDHRVVINTLSQQLIGADHTVAVKRMKSPTPPVLLVTL